MAGGLLDYSPDPVGMGLLSMGSALMTPRAMGGGLGPGLLAFNQGAMQAQMMQRQQAQDAIREQLFMAQMDNYKSESEQRKAAAEEKRRLTAQAEAQAVGQRKVLEAFAGPPMGFRDANVAAGGTAPAGYVPPTQGGQITREMAAAWVANGGNLETLQKLAESRNFGRDEVARVIEGRDAAGNPVNLQATKFGDTVGAPIPKAVQAQYLNTGGAQTGVNPFTGAPMGGSFPITMSASERDASARGWASNALARERFAAEQEAGKRPQTITTNEGVYVVTPGKAGGMPTFTPATGLDGKSLVGPKPATEAQSKDFLFASRAAAANDIVAGLKNLSIYGAATNANLANAPLVGGVLSTAQSFALGPDTLRYMQAKRDFINAVLRKESGAVIGKDEFDSADKQYFPQPGEERFPEVVKQKAEARARAIQGISAGAGPLAANLRTAPPASASALPGQPSITDLVNKYANPR